MLAQKDNEEAKIAGVLSSGRAGVGVPSRRLGARGVRAVVAGPRVPRRRGGPFRYTVPAGRAMRPRHGVVVAAGVDIW